MVKYMVRVGVVMAIALAGMGVGGGCVFDENGDDVIGDVADVLTPADIPDAGGGGDVASEIEQADFGLQDVGTTDVGTQDGSADGATTDVVTHDNATTDNATTDLAVPDTATSDNTTSDTTTPDALDQDSAGPDAAPEDTGCEPSCNGLECGPDPVCGTLDCGSCPDGLGCVGGKCGVVGCYSALEYMCDEAYAANDGATLDLGAIRDECVARGASWQACPTGDRVLTVGISKADGSSMLRSYYLGLYCGAGDALGMAAFEFGVSSLDPHYMITPSGCSTEMIDSVGCMKSESTMSWCVELDGGVPVDKAAAFNTWCTDFAAGFKVEGCPVNEGGACEIAPSYNDEWHTVIHYYPSGDPAAWQVGDLSEQQSHCNSPALVWIPAECSEEVTAYGPCNFAVNKCAHLAGDWDAPYWEVWVTDYDAHAQGMGVSWVSLDDAKDKAMTDLGLQISLPDCL